MLWPEWFAEAGLGSSYLPAQGKPNPNVSFLQTTWLNNHQGVSARRMTRWSAAPSARAGWSVSLMSRTRADGDPTRSPCPRTRGRRQMIAGVPELVTGGGRGGGRRAGVSLHKPPSEHVTWMSGRIGTKGSV